MVMVREFGESLFWVAALLVPPLSLVALFLVFTSRRSLQQEALLQVMAMAARESQPIGPAVSAFGPTCRGHYARKVAELGYLLERGDSLPDALDRVPDVLNKTSTTIARVGWETGTLRRMLNDATETMSREKTARNVLAGAISYPLLVLAILLGLAVFLTVRVAPQMAGIFKEGNLELPEPTRTVFAIGQTAAGYLISPDTPTSALFCVLVGGCAGVLILIGIFLLPRLFEKLPWLNGFARRRHMVVVLKALAAAMELGQTVPAVLDRLATIFPRHLVRNRLAKTSKRVQQGEPWIKALQAEGLLGSADVALLGSAERLGNLPWALREAADSSQRRSLYRLMAWGQIFQMLTIAGLGLIVLLFAITYFRPLITMIDALSRNA
jgi:type II secretory pathway component PulF